MDTLVCQGFYCVSLQRNFVFQQIREATMTLSYALFLQTVRSYCVCFTYINNQITRLNIVSNSPPRHHIDSKIQ